MHVQDWQQGHSHSGLRPSVAKVLAAGPGRASEICWCDCSGRSRPVGRRVRSRQCLPGVGLEVLARNGQVGLLQQAVPTSAPEHPGLRVWASPGVGGVRGWGSVEFSRLSQGSCTHCYAEVSRPLDPMQWEGQLLGKVGCS